MGKTKYFEINTIEGNSESSYNYAKYSDGYHLVSAKNTTYIDDEHNKLDISYNISSSLDCYDNNYLPRSFSIVKIMNKTSYVRIIHLDYILENGEYVPYVTLNQTFRSRYNDPEVLQIYDDNISIKLDDLLENNNQYYVEDLDQNFSLTETNNLIKEFISSANDILTYGFFTEDIKKLEK